MFALHYRKHTIKIALLSICIIAAIVTVVSNLITKNDQNRTYAATGDGSSVTAYGEYSEEQHFTDIYINNGSSTFQAYCAKTSLPGPSNGSSWPAELVNIDQLEESKKRIFDKMKLLIFINENSGSNSYAAAAKNTIFNLWPGNTGTQAWYTKYTHYMLSVIYSNDWTYIENESIPYINRGINYLEEYINNNADIWTIAKNYSLYRIQPGSAYQDIVWIEDGTTYGTIKVNKIDAETGNTPQGSASLAGIRFELYNASGSRIYNPSTNAFYDNNEMITYGLTNNNGEVIFTQLLANNIRYTVKEAATNVWYQLNTNEENVALTTPNETKVVQFQNIINKGKITVNKIDKDTGTCANTIGLSFSGVTISITNNSNNPIKYQGQIKAKNDIVDTKTITNSCSVSFENLPYGSYIIKETATSKGYILNNTPQIVAIPTNDNANITITINNQPIRGDVTFIKKDSTNKKPLSNVVFSISSVDENQNIKETHLVVSNEDGIVNTSSSFNLHSNHTNGYDSLYDNNSPIAYSGYGTWFGIDQNGTSIPASDSVGALPYGTYIIQELSCDSNQFCHNINDQTRTIVIDQANQIVDLGTWNNECTDFKLETNATDAKDDDKYIEAEEKAKLKDTISYCVTPGKDFIIKGTIMDKATGKPLTIDGKTIESSIDLKSEEKCGQIEMIFDLNASELAGKEIVVFESLYYGNEIIVKHEDINDSKQTVKIIAVTPPTPDTGRFQKSKDNSESTNTMIIIGLISAVGIFTYTANRIISKKSFLKRK